jgi:UDP-3-O-[3-hydroxymyristoyl] glucosamine N-acyltransferase
VKLKDVASFVKGKIIGPPGADDIEITGVSGIHDAREGDISFIAAQKYIRELAACKASCVIVKEALPDITVTQLTVANPYRAFAQLLEHFYVKPIKFSGISDGSIVAEHSHIADDATVFPFCYIADGVTIGSGTIIYPYVFIGENTVIGSQCVIYPHVTLSYSVRIGDNVIIHSGSVVGSDGFGYVFDEGRYHKIPQVGGVIIEDDVEIGSNVSIDRATLGNTVIGKGTKIDNLVQIAHNVTIGNNSVLVSQVGIAGSTEIGDYVTLAGQVGISDHAKIDSGTIIGAQSGIRGHLTKGTYIGTPALPQRDWMKAQAIVAKLPALRKKIKELEEKIRELERRNSE